MAPIGLMIAGPVAEQVGIQAWFFLAGSVCLALAVAGACIPAVMNIEEGRSLVSAPQGHPIPEPVEAD